MAVGCAEDDPEVTDDGSAAEDSGTIEDEEFIVVVRGQLAGAEDLSAAREMHDAVARNGEAAAKEAGDHAHDVLLGTAMLDSTENEFLAIDRWDDADAMVAWYADPAFQEAFAGLFAAPPTLQFFRRAPEWVNWGEMDSGDVHDPYYFHLAIGTLAESDPSAAQAAHDAVASGGKEPSIGAGNVAHVVFVGLEDPREFVAVDIWSVGEPIEPFYSSPQFQDAFAPLFTAVSEPVYESTDWHQW
jgi:quinol monooxygenase YgiN